MHHALVRPSNVCYRPALRETCSVRTRTGFAGTSKNIPLGLSEILSSVRESRYTRLVSAPFRKLVALLISAALLLAGSGYTGAFASSLEHDLGVEMKFGGPVPDEHPQGKVCSHGCGSHLAAHLVVLSNCSGTVALSVVAAQPAALLTAIPLRFRVDSLYRPPQTLLG